MNTSNTYSADSNNLITAAGEPVNASVVSYSTMKNDDYSVGAPTVATIPEDAPPRVAQQPGQKGYVYVGSRMPVTLTCCPRCAEQQITTRAVTKPTGTTWACVGVGFLVFWPICWVPLVGKSWKQTNHYCTNCGGKVGRVKPFG